MPAKTARWGVTKSLPVLDGGKRTTQRRDVGLHVGGERCTVETARRSLGARSAVAPLCSWPVRAKGQWRRGRGEQDAPKTLTILPPAVRFATSTSCQHDVRLDRQKDQAARGSNLLC